MSYVQKTIENAAVGVAVLDDPDEFSVFRKPGVAAAIWRRQLPHDFQNWIDSVPHENLPSARIIIKADIVTDAIDTICSHSGVPNTLNRRFFVNDVAMLVNHFARLMKTETIGLRLDVIRDDACRKFHIDAVTARLVCTYRGLGTQYGISTDGTEPTRIFSAPTGAPMLLRGTKWPEPPASGLLHRSPPIDGTGITRLVLVIDPIFDEPDDA